MKAGLILPMGEDESTGSVRTWQTIRELAVAAEDDGLDAVWVYDHLLFHFEGKDPQGVWEAWTIWSALAEATERVELGALVLCTAFRNPAVLAKMAVTLDEVSHGRVVLGLGAGWHQPEFDAFGLDFSHKVDQFEEAVEIIAPLVREGAVDFQGNYHSANHCIQVPPPQRRIPILIAGFQPRMMGLVARHADSWNTCWHGQVSSIEDRLADLQSACDTQGRDFSTLEITAGINVAFPELESPPEEVGDPDKYLSGSVEDVAEGLQAYRDRGVKQVIASLSPLTVESVGLYAEAARLV